MPDLGNEPIGNPCAAADAPGDHGKMRALIRSFDWAGTSLGPIGSWSPEFGAAVNLCLTVEYPIILYGGPDLTVIYNDTYREFLGTKHPTALGRPCREVWSEIWDAVGPIMAGLMEGGAGTRFQDALLYLRRDGRLQEGYYDYTLSPIRGAEGEFQGIFCAAVETSWRIIAERRGGLLRILTENMVSARSAEEVCAVAVGVLETARLDVPFALIYLYEEGERRTTARLVGAVGLPPDGPASPTLIEWWAETQPPKTPWPPPPNGNVPSGEIIGDLTARFGMTLPGSRDRDPADSALVTPLRRGIGAEKPVGFLVVGLSPNRPLDDEYRDFAKRLATRIAEGIGEVHAQQEARRRTEALADLDRAKTAFFSNVSHEFRTPLTLMLGPTEDLLADSAGELSTAQRGSLEIVHRNARRLLKLVNALLDFARAEAGRLQARFRPTDVAMLTTELASNFKSACERAGIDLIVDCPPLPRPIHVDPDIWEKIILNLISNAVKFTFVGAIEVTLRSDGDGMTLTISDSGVGIPVDELPQIFERFHRVQSVRGRVEEGTGIGLALVRDFVELHGGSIHVTSVVGRGSAFRITLPFGSVHLPPELVDDTPASSRDAERSKASVDEITEWLSAQSRPSSNEAMVEESPRKGTGCRILLVDDNRDMRGYVARILESAGHRVDVAVDGGAALEAAFRLPPYDLILTDVMMPVLDGSGLLRRLREDERTAGALIIMLSARAGEEARIEGLTAGADDYLVKPFNAQELLVRIDTAVALQRLRRAAALRERSFREREAHPGGDETLRLALDVGHLGTWEIDLLSERILQSPQYDRIFGYAHPLAEWSFTTVIEHVVPEDREMVRRALSAVRAGERELDVECRILRSDGALRWVKVQGMLSPHTGDRPPGMYGVIIDVSERRLAEERVHFLAYHDPLTELPNRLLVRDRVDQAIAIAKRTGELTALLYLDLDNFKLINDSLGHSVGDALLKAVTDRLKGCVSKDDTLSRLGGDEFLILLREMEDERPITATTGRILDRLGKPFDIDGHSLSASVSIGVSVFPADGDDFESLYRKADLAMYSAKNAGRNTCHFFDAGMNEDADERLRLSGDLRRALEREEFVLHYQPQFAMEDGAVVGAEALIRWNHPERGLIPPGRFIPVAEDSGLIVPIGEWVLRTACRQAAAWPDAQWIVAVNLSAIQFKRADLAEVVGGALEASGLDPSRLELELTESVVISDFDTVLNTLRRLKALGVGLSIDDFGTGYSSLAYLTRLSIDKLKIDQSFVRSLPTGKDDTAIIRAIIQMAANLELVTIAEGVENEDQLAFLRANGCDMVQGYLLARPMPVEALSGWRPRSDIFVWKSR